MCQHVVVLAKRTERRYSTQCEHGTAHLIWERATLQLHPVECAHLADVLEHWGAYAHETTVGEGCIRIFEHPHGAVQVWIHGAGLYLQPVDLLMFTDLVQASARRLAQAAVRPVALRVSCFSAEYRELGVVPGSACFAN
jgi:hypothetical protein